MKKSLFCFVLLISMSFSACRNPGPPISNSPKTDIEKQILEQWDKISTSIEKVDVDSYSAFFNSDEFLGMYSEGVVFQSKPEYIDTVRVWFGKRKSNQTEQKSVKVSVLTENLAILDQSSIFQANLLDDKKIRINHAVTFIFKKGTSGWKIIHGHESWKNI